ncbi:hypothetical protein [Commensalibacter nepenthis]|uniref:Lysozyme inhibitor LprI N-terminal domain-containing protein n=1 Tax=Commensalibacter nepenthis TaxID=3043872 RepID=A0ABT6Q9P0_9PROT|nr:hypothetical protein [Commensalibacter sp. TBRC 10068]MDI2113025.1 hypothetical protein [Commensalibacter sp. TBRC 10068]
MKENLPRCSKEELTNFNRILIKRYDNLRNINAIKSELSFWYKFRKDLQKEKEANKVAADDTYQQPISILEQIIRKIEESIKNKET